MNRTNTLIWLVLILLTSVSFILGEHKAASQVILALSGLKFTLVARYFMDLRTASPVWTVATLFLLIIGLGIGFSAK